MPDYTENLFKSLKKGCFPSADGDLEKQLRLAFFYGMDAGRQLMLKGTELPGNAMVEFYSELGFQVNEQLALLGKNPAKINLAQLKLN